MVKRGVGKEAGLSYLKSSCRENGKSKGIVTLSV